MEDYEKPSSLIEAVLNNRNQEEVRVPLSRLDINENEMNALYSLVTEEKKEKLEIEWVVDVADNNLNWFIATAYLYDDESRTIKVAIPDRNEPQWEGYLPLDHRCIHLMECCDTKSMALYKYISSLWTQEVCWRVSWWIDEESNQQHGIAKYYAKITNALYVVPDRNVTAAAINKAHDDEIEEIMLDEQLTLIEVLTPDGGHEEFEQLVVDGVVQWKDVSNGNSEENQLVKSNQKSILEVNLEPLERLAADAAHCLQEALRDRCISQVEHAQVRDSLRDFVAAGNLDAFKKIVQDAEDEALAQTAAKREQHRDSTLALISRSETRFWKKAAAALLFRRNYKAGDRVLVLLCHGLGSVAGTIAKVHSDDESYDVDLQPTTPNDVSTEVGIRIPPEYLRPLELSQTNTQDNNDQKMRIQRLYEKRKSLQKELEALEGQRRQALEASQKLAAAAASAKKKKKTKSDTNADKEKTPEAPADDFHLEEILQSEDKVDNRQKVDTNQDDDDDYDDELSRASSSQSAQQQPAKQRNRGSITRSVSTKVSKGLKSMFGRKKSKL